MSICVRLVASAPVGVQRWPQVLALPAVRGVRNESEELGGGLEV